MEPAASIIAKLGGPAKVAEITGAANPYRWKYPRDKGGTGGWIPHWYHERLLAYAKQNKIPLSANEFMQAETNNNKKRKVAP